YVNTFVFQQDRSISRVRITSPEQGDVGAAPNSALPAQERAAADFAPPEMRSVVVDVLGMGKGHDFAATRSKELGIMDGLLAGRYDAKIAHAEVDSWSTWLQLRAASDAGSRRFEEAALAGHLRFAMAGLRPLACRGSSWR